MTANDQTVSWGDGDIAIVGMAAHLPGAGGLDAYWHNLKNGIESIRQLDRAALEAAGESPARMRHRNYVPAAAVLDDFEKFDAEFFGLSPKEAAIMDPQHRQFLEVSWEAFENAAHMPETFDGPIGVFAGCGMGSYFYFNICSNRDLVDSTGMFLLRHTGNDKDFLSTRLSHILDLKGPSLGIQTACSTSLVAVHYASQSLLNGECDMALAGGVTIELPHGRGYVFQEGEILSPDGHCHAFDHRAQGTVFGSGAGVVVLRRMADAVADGDHIWAVIKGSSVNNDGSAKAGYLAPSVDGQAAAVAEALALAEVTADTIDYVECHGTGTYLGDPIEVAALTEAFRETTQETGFCRIGSVKTNIGHLDTAAGAASLIKTSLSLHNRQIPPSLGYEKPNPAIPFEKGPFHVNDRLSDWISHKGPRRAGVNSLGVGGTNAHVVLEEAPERAPSLPSDFPFQVLTISGRTAKALDANTKNLTQHLRDHPEQPLEDIAFTLMNGRRAFEKRRIVVAETHAQATKALEDMDPRRVFTHSANGMPEPVFMFPGGGAQYIFMGRDLYETEPVFRDWMDRGFDWLAANGAGDLKNLWLAEETDTIAAEKALQQPSKQLPLILLVEVALAKLLISWGVQPAALVGHSMGENTAACLAGVMSFEDCLGLVKLRGDLFDTVAPGGMLSVPLSLGDLEPYLSHDIDIAGLNAPTLTVVSGPRSALDALAETLSDNDVESQRIQIDIAAHSAMLEPVLDRFRDYLRSITLSPPRLPIISNRTGAELSDQDATDPDYWVDHLRNTVRFGDCLTTLAQDPNRVFLEVGPGKALSSLARMNGAIKPDRVVPALRHPEEDVTDDAFFLEVLGRLWACGLNVDWEQYWGDTPRQRVVLPSYAFQRSPYFIEPGKVQNTDYADLVRLDDRAGWRWVPAWKPRLAECEIDVGHELHLAERHSWLIFTDEGGIGADIATRLRAAGHSVVEVSAGDGFARLSDDRYSLAPERGREGYDALVADLMAHGRAPDRILHMWLFTESETFRPGSSFFHRNQEQGLYSLFFLAQAIEDEGLPRPIHLTTLTSGAVRVRQEPLLHPEKATAFGPVQVIPRELSGVTVSLLDVDLPGRKTDDRARLVDRVLEETLSPPSNLIAAWRGDKRFERLHRKIPETHSAGDFPVWKDGGTYLITGGFGGIGQALAERMIRQAGAKVVLVARGGVLARDHWAHHLATHGPLDRMSRRIRALERLEALGGQVLCVDADVCNLDEMKRAVADARDRFGPINGVIHAAGVIEDAPLLAKTSIDIDDVLAPKLHGTEVLDTIFPDGSIDWMALFASSSTVTAPVGQVDYVAANAFLNAYAQSRAGGKTKVVAVNWGLWSDVGMAADAVASRTAEAAPPEMCPTNASLLQQAGFDANGHRIFETTLTNRDWIIDEHRTIDGQALLPGTGYLELIAEALAEQRETGPFEIRDLLFLRPLPVADGGRAHIRMRLTRTDEGYHVEVMSACKIDGRAAWLSHAEARILLGRLPAFPALDVEGLQASLPVTKNATKSSLRSPQEAFLNFGPRWRVLQSTRIGEGEGLARLALEPEHRSDISENGFRLHPALMDLATGWAMQLIPGYEARHLWVPLSYGRVRVYCDLPSEIVSHVTLTHGDASSGEAGFDVTLATPDGKVCAVIQSFSIRRVDSTTSFTSAAPPRPNEVVFDDLTRSADRPLSTSEERLVYNLSQGIMAWEGVEEFELAMALGLPEIVISSLDLEALKQQAEAAGSDDAISGQAFERPELENDFIAPRNDIERTLAGFWQELLGVEQVGVEDSFFDLGGHSLIAVRLFAMIKKTWHADFPISVLFEAPTVAGIARLIEGRVGPQADSGGGAAVEEAPTRRFTHIVPMHDGEGGRRAPFFLVAGMFGNVLNLRHLAHLIGADRPFYGLQARGLFGDAAPHDDIEQAARDYLAEIKTVQPEGPYFIGGFSGGGITAYEIARQLEEGGDEVAIVVMLDTPLPRRRPLTTGDRIKIQLQELKRGGIAYPFVWFKRRIAWEKTKRAQKKVGTDTSHHFHNAEIEAAFLNAVAGYQLRPWSGPVALFRPPLVGKWDLGHGRLVNHERSYVTDDNDWGDWVSELQVFEVPGDHDSMVLEPNVRVLASRMKSVIEQAAQRLRTRADRREAAE
ncbi:type I polyketide synthase [Shimia biformata]|uniref:type I polyketide synthase n=1 Tax=Shimia biformata TaxID=1294299 RepID=UPI0019518FFF|nr:type I polyketide synthase [Shimia biformata]